MPLILKDKPKKRARPLPVIEREEGGRAATSPIPEDGQAGGIYQPAHDAGIGTPRPGYLGRLFSYRPAFYGALLVATVILMTILAPLLTPYGRDAIDLDAILSSPSADHVLGTDEIGRDLFTRIMYGGRVTLLVALSSIALATCIGLLLGAMAGYFGGFWESLVTAAIDLFMSIPVFLVLLVAAALGGGRVWLIPLIIGSTMWMETARVVRARLLQLKREGYVEAARSLGSNDLSILVRHLLPQALPAVIVAATIGFAHAMLIESALSFLGFGIQPPVPTWGNMLQNAQAFLRTAPLAAAAPGLMIFITCLCFNSIGDGLRRALADREPTC